MQVSWWKMIYLFFLRIYKKLNKKLNSGLRKMVTNCHFKSKSTATWINMLSVRAFKGISKSPVIILSRLTAQVRKRNCHSVFRNLIDDMSNNTTCFLLNNISSPCGSTNESKNRIPYAHAAILPSTIVIVILSPGNCGGW